MSEGETKDFIMGYTKKIEECKHESAPLFTDGYLAGNVISFLLGGTLTTTTTIMWHMLNFSNNPGTVQARVQREIDNVVGHERQPNWEDRKRMPYTMACILEMQRWKTVVPLGVSRESAEDVVIGDFFIAKGTVIIPNIWAVHNDPGLWEEPATFKPERFLREDGSLLPRKPDHLIPFCVGRTSGTAAVFTVSEIFSVGCCAHAPPYSKRQREGQRKDIKPPKTRWVTAHPQCDEQLIKVTPRKLSKPCSHMAGDVRKNAFSGKKHTWPYRDCGDSVLYELSPSCGKSCIGQASRSVIDRAYQYELSLTTDR
ncbi:hypothetical protein HPB50_007606 [Hyalomma asiaticum]|uniref:Uncharacterized protein n=1 Tax=Hyalomma asiaticum TaxID=266040 RepID=A0ACB7RSY9_HYAAI|nr:hypothetical protein HPB50_007606 [Hyalomma asiaticum]